MLNTELSALSAQLTKEIVSALPEGGVGMNGKTSLVQANMARIQETLQQSNTMYDSQIQSGVTEQDAMGSYVLNVFSTAFAVSESFGYEKFQDRILAAQKMTDAVMKTGSPMRGKQEKFAEFADGFILKNSHLFLNELRGESTELQNFLSQAFEGANKAYAAPQNEREQMQIPSLGERAQDVVPPVQEEQKLGVPVKLQ